LSSDQQSVIAPVRGTRPNVGRNPVTPQRIDGLTMLQSPTLSGDGRRIVFSAIEARGRMDLFLLQLEDGKLERLTEDGYSEDDNLGLAVIENRGPIN